MVWGGYINLTEINMATQERKKVVTYRWDAATNLLTFSVNGAGSFMLDVLAVVGEAFKQLTPTGQRSVVHGLVQKVSDKAAVGRDPETGRSATPSEKFARMKATGEALAQGVWSSRSAVESLNRAALFAAVAAVRQVAPEKVAAKFQAQPDAVLKTLLTVSSIAAEYARLTTPQGGDSAEVEGMLAELE